MTTHRRKAEPVARESANIVADLTERLKVVFPEAVSEGKIDFDRLRTALGEAVDSRQERYSFTWAGKRDAIQVLQVPSRATLVPVPDESVNFRDTGHIFIEGENLEVLKLLYKSYFGRVKMVYIDPPYNTGNDFIYPDNFADPLDYYLKLTGQKDSEGNLLTTNPETSGRYHSAWLSMMYPRLFLARQLLQDDGVIFVSIDDHEVHNLRLLMNEIFGEENFIAQITIQSNPRGRQAERFVATVHEYVIVYSKDANQCKLSGSELTEEQMKEFKYQDKEGRKYRLLGLRQRGSASRREDRPHMFYPLYINPTTGTVSISRAPVFNVEVYPRKSTGADGRWMWAKEKVAKEITKSQARLISRRNEWDVFVRDYLDSEEGNARTRKLKTLWIDKALNYQNGTQEVKDLLGEGIYEYPKPTALLREIITMAGDENAICLDFFAGSCTTAHAILEMNQNDGGNRQFIMIQLPEPTPEDSRARKAGYDTIAQIGKERIRRVIDKLKKEEEGKLPLQEEENSPELGFKVFKLTESNYRPWQGTEEAEAEAYARQMALHADPLVDGWKVEDVIWEVALKEGFGLGSRIESLEGVKDCAIYRVTDHDRGQSFAICLDDKVELDALKPLDLSSEDLFICRDSAITDEAAANLALQCRLKTI